MSRRRAPNRPRRETLTRERVLHAALDLADERGIDALSMRELGRHLGVDAMSLYNHVDNKDDLLNGIVDLVVGEIDLPPDEVDWSDAMRTRALCAQAAFTRHPWASQLMDSRTSSGPERLRYFDWVIGKRFDGPGSPSTWPCTRSRRSTATSTDSPAEQANASSDEPSSTEAAQELLSEIPTDQFPHLTEVITHDIRHGGYDPDTDFDFGLNLILDSLQRLLDKATKPDDPAT